MGRASEASVSVLGSGASGVWGGEGERGGLEGCGRAKRAYRRRPRKWSLKAKDCEAIIYTYSTVQYETQLTLFIHLQLFKTLKKHEI